MAWNTVEIVAAPGTQFGILSDKNGKLTIVTRRACGELWPHGIKDAEVEAQNEIADGCTRYIIMPD